MGCSFGVPMNKFDRFTNFIKQCSIIVNLFARTVHTSLLPQQKLVAVDGGTVKEGNRDIQRVGFHFRFKRKRF